MKGKWHVLVLMLSIAWYAVVLVSPSRWPYLNILSGGIPLWIAFLTFMLVFALPLGLRQFWGVLLSLILGLPFVLATYGLNFSKVEAIKPITVLSYNVNGFNVVDSKVGSNQDFVDWVVGFDADIKVIQEFYTNDRDKGKDFTSAFKKKGYHFYVSPGQSLALGHIHGMAIFSKYPIIASGKLMPEIKGINNVIYADILYQGDTVRIYNIHLHSMGINPENAFQTLKLEGDWRQVMHQLTHGASKRAVQIAKCWDHISTSPYPVIIAGDFNELPYSYAYWKFRRSFKNAFEAKGSGFGFTMNSKLFFLRIDNIFFGNGLIASQFTTHRKIKYSDHFPISATLMVNN